MFTINELTKTNYLVPNEPNEEQIVNLQRVIREILIPARTGIGMPIVVNSGFRSAELNALVGGVENSYHLQGRAVDICCRDNRMLYNWIRANCRFKELIGEKPVKGVPRWVHVAL